MVIEWVLPFSKLGSAGREAGARMGRRSTHCVCAVPLGRAVQEAVEICSLGLSGDRNGAVTNSRKHLKLECMRGPV